MKGKKNREEKRRVKRREKNMLKRKEDTYKIKGTKIREGSIKQRKTYRKEYYI